MASSRPSPVSPTSASRSGSACCWTSATACSGSASSDARAAVERFLFTLLDPADEFFLTAFNHAARLLTPWTSTPSVVSDALASLRPSGGTAIYDAVVSALPQIERRNRQRAALWSSPTAPTPPATRRCATCARRCCGATPSSTRSRSIRRTGYAINTRVNPAALSEITSQSGGRTEVVHDVAGPAGGDRAHRRRAEQPVRAGLLLAEEHRREIPQHPRGDEATRHCASARATATWARRSRAPR